MGQGGFGIMEDSEKLARCFIAWNRAKDSGSLCKVYGRNIGSCMDCGISVYRQLILDKRCKGC